MKAASALASVVLLAVACTPPDVDTDGPFADAGVGDARDGGNFGVSNRAPTANAGADQTVSVDELVALYGGGSSDPDDDVLSFTWALADVPPGSAATLSSPSGVNPTFTPDLAGTYVVKLVVDDGTDASEPDVVEIEAVARARPIADAGDDELLQLGDTLTLDGSGSTAAAGGTLSYAWQLAEVPAGGATAIANSTSPSATFTPEVVGTYLLELVVVEDGLSSAPDGMFVTVYDVPPPGNRAPVASITAPTSAAVGSEVLVDGSSSYDLDGDTLTYQWTLEAPSGSAAAVPNAAGASWSFVADVAGTYSLTLVVNDGGASSAADTHDVVASDSPAPIAGAVTVLDFLVSDAEYSAALDLVVLMTDSSSVATLNPTTGAVAEVALPLLGLAVSVAPDGLTAVVGHDAYVTEVTLDPLAIVQTLPLGAICGDVVTSETSAHCFPTNGQWTNIYTVNLTSGAEATSGGSSLRERTVAKLHPDGTRLYGADNGLSPADIERYDIDENGVANVTGDSPYHGDYAMCGNLWLTEDGARIVTACGNVFRASNDADLDMTYNGSVDVPGRIAHASHSMTAGLLAAVDLGSTFGPTTDPTLVRLFEDQFLATEQPLQLPEFPLGGTNSVPAEGRFVFFSSDGAELIVIVQAEEGSGALLDYGYTVVDLP